jgi:hypothetical protein
MKRFSILRSATFIVGAALTVGAFLAYLVLGNLFNPPPYQVLVVVQDVAPGETLTDSMVATSAQRISGRVASGYVLAGELDQFRGAMVVEPMHPGDPLTKNRLVRAGNPAAERRAALGLEDPDKVLMVVPADEKNVSAGVAAGDRIDLIYSVGQPPQSNLPTPAPFTGYSATPVPPRAPAQPGQAVVATPDLQVGLPLAKLVFYDLTVVHVRREQKPNPAYSGQQGESPYIDGAINALELLVPRAQQELLQWSVATGGKVAVAIVSPEAPKDQRVETFGMTWDDLLAWFKSEREKRLEAVMGGEPPLPSAPGAYAFAQATAVGATATANAQTYSSYSQPTVTTAAITNTTVARPASTPVTTAQPATVAPPAPVATVVPTATSTRASKATPTSVVQSPSGPGNASPSGLATALAFLACGVILLAVIGVTALAFIRARKKNA